MENLTVLTHYNPLSIMAHLKIATQQQHLQTEQVYSMKRLFADDYTLAEYSQHLQKMYGYFSVIDPFILQILRSENLQHFSFNSFKQTWLKQDLYHLGLSENDLAILPQISVPTYINTPSQALGVCYVLEGSSLGNQVIFKQLSQHFAEIAADKLRFYQGHGQQTRSKWQQFGELLNHQFANAEPIEIQAAITAAQVTFDSLTTWLTVQ
jgi:heme oxygenase